MRILLCSLIEDTVYYISVSMTGLQTYRNGFRTINLLNLAGYSAWLPFLQVATTSTMATSTSSVSFYSTTNSILVLPSTTTTTQDGTKCADYLYLL